MMSLEMRQNIITKLRNDEPLGKLEEELFVKNVAGYSKVNKLSFEQTMDYIRRNFGASILTKYRNINIKINFCGRY